MMMKEKVGEVFSIAMDNPAIPGCTISKAVHDGANDIICFSLARNTDISAEIYPYHKLIIMAEGVIEIYGADGFRRNLHTSESIITLTDTPMGIRTAEGAVYTEVSIRRSEIVNMDVVHNDKMKFVIMAFDAGTELSEHAAPGEALIFVLDGEGVIGYEGKEHPIKAGENFRFAKAGIHSVKAAKRFKMALLLTLES